MKDSSTLSALRSSRNTSKETNVPEPDTLSDNYDDPSRLEREFHQRGWQPVMMRDVVTGLPFTGWFPPAKDGSDPERRLLPEDVDRSPNARTS